MLAGLSTTALSASSGLREWFGTASWHGLARNQHGADWQILAWRHIRHRVGTVLVIRACRLQCEVRVLQSVCKV